MQRRSFFGVVFGGLVASRWRRPPKSVVCIDPAAPHYLPDPKYRFGFTGFKPAQQSGKPPQFAYRQMPAGFYKPGDTFVISGRDFGNNPRMRYKTFTVPVVD